MTRQQALSTERDWDTASEDERRAAGLWWRRNLRRELTRLESTLADAQQHAPPAIPPNLAEFAPLIRQRWESRLASARTRMALLRGELAELGWLDLLRGRITECAHRYPGLEPAWSDLELRLMIAERRLRDGVAVDR